MSDAITDFTTDHGGQVLARFLGKMVVMTLRERVICGTVQTVSMHKVHLITLQEGEVILSRYEVKELYRVERVVN